MYKKSCLLQGSLSVLFLILSLAITIMYNFLMPISFFPNLAYNYCIISQARSQGGSDEPLSQIKGPLFYKKVHYLQTKGSLLLCK